MTDVESLRVLRRAADALGLTDHVEREVADRGHVRPHVGVEIVPAEQHVGDSDDRGRGRSELVLVRFDLGHVQAVMHQSVDRAIGRTTQVSLSLANNRPQAVSGERPTVGGGACVGEDALAVVRPAHDSDRPAIVAEEPRVAPREQSEREPERERKDMHDAPFDVHRKHTA